MLFELMETGRTAEHAAEVDMLHGKIDMLQCIMKEKDAQLDMLKTEFGMHQAELQAELQDEKKAKKVSQTRVDELEETHKCSICLERDMNAVLGCGHLFCLQCLRRVLASADTDSHRCPKCRKHFTRHSYHRVYLHEK